MNLQSVTIKDSKSGAYAKIAAGFGFNCYDFTVQLHGKPLPILWSANDFEAGTARPSGSGIPILFPFPGRIHGTVLRWEGREYQLQEGDGRGNAIHGFVMNRPWRIVEHAASRVVGEFHASKDDPALMNSWPADFRIRVSYELIDHSLHSEIEIANPDSRPLPCGLGTHPYFRLPLGGPTAEDCIVKLPVSSQWELENMTTTGVRTSLSDADELQQGKRFSELKLDNVFSGLVTDGGRVYSQIVDPAANLRVEQVFDSSFSECVVYTPPHREAICIEPYSCVPGCFDLESRGIAAGLRVLKPGETFTARIEIRVAADRAARR